MKKFKVLTVVAVMALISSGMFNACKKDVVNQNETVLTKQQKSVVLPPDIIALIESYVDAAYVNEEYTITGENGLVYSLFITDDESILAEWHAEITAAGKTVHTFEHNSELLVGVAWTQTPVVIVTEEERQFLGAPMSMDVFAASQASFIEMATVKMGCYFVVSVNADGTVQNQLLSARTSHTEWYNRLHEYFEIAKIDPRPIIPLLDGECRHADNKDDLQKITDECLENGWDYCVTTKRDSSGNITGYTVCIENGIDKKNTKDMSIT